MDKFGKLLKSLLGDQGVETLKKGIYKQDSQSSLETIDTFLPLLVVPRSILSWLVQNIQPMKIGSNKTLDFPGKEDIKIDIDKLGRDSYRANFIQGGKVVHTFEKQSLPNIGGHLMTVGEMYDSFVEDEAPSHGMETPMAIMDMSTEAHGHNSESYKWEMAHANVKELSAVIGKLVDALVSNNMMRQALDISENIKTLKNDIDLEKQTAMETAASSIRGAFGSDSSAPPSSTPKEESPPPVPSLGSRIASGLSSLVGKSDSEPVAKTTLGTTEMDTNKKTNLRSAYVRNKRNQEILRKPKLDKGIPNPAKGAEVPAGQALDNQPKQPKEAVKPGKNPIAQLKQQGQVDSRMGEMGQKSQQHSMVSTAQMKQPKQPKGYFRNKLDKVQKSEKIAKEYFITESEMFNRCVHCGVSEFVKNEDGSIKYQPCACFMVTQKSGSENDIPFVEIIRKSESGAYQLRFNPKADADVVKAFLMTIKNKLIEYKNK